EEGGNGRLNYSAIHSQLRYSAGADAGARERPAKPFDSTVFDEVEREARGRTFSAATESWEARARQAEAEGDPAGVREGHLRAYGCFRVARYPAPSLPAKRPTYGHRPPTRERRAASIPRSSAW